MFPLRFVDYYGVVSVHFHMHYPMAISDHFCSKTILRSFDFLFFYFFLFFFLCYMVIMYMFSYELEYMSAWCYLYLHVPLVYVELLVHFLITQHTWSR